MQPIFSGLLTVNASAIVPYFSPLGPILHFEDLRASIFLQKNVGSSANSTSTDATALLDFSGKIFVGGDDGFEATVVGVVDFAAEPSDRYMTLSLSHPGGWAPLPDMFDPFFTTPAFGAQLVLGPGAFMTLDAHVQFVKDIPLLPKVVALVADPLQDYPGVQMALSLVRHSNASINDMPDYEVRASGGLRLGPEGFNAIPVFGFSGLISSTGTSYLEVSSSPFSPLGLEKVMPFMVVPGLVGRLTLERSGAMTVTAAAVPMSFCFAGDLVCFDELTASVFVDLPVDEAAALRNVTLDTEELNSDANLEVVRERATNFANTAKDSALDEGDSNQNLDVVLRLSGTATIGGANGFSVTVVGEMSRDYPVYPPPPHSPPIPSIPPLAPPTIPSYTRVQTTCSDEGFLPIADWEECNTAAFASAEANNLGFVSAGIVQGDNGVGPLTTAISAAWEPTGCSVRENVGPTGYQKLQFNTQDTKYGSVGWELDSNKYVLCRLPPAVAPTVSPPGPGAAALPNITSTAPPTSETVIQINGKA